MSPCGECITLGLNIASGVVDFGVDKKVKAYHITPTMNMGGIAKNGLVHTREERDKERSPESREEQTNEDAICCVKNVSEGLIWGEVMQDERIHFDAGCGFGSVLEDDYESLWNHEGLEEFTMLVFDADESSMNHKHPLGFEHSMGEVRVAQSFPPDYIRVVQAICKKTGEVVSLNTLRKSLPPPAPGCPPALNVTENEQALMSLYDFTEIPLRVYMQNIENQKKVGKASADQHRRELNQQIYVANTTMEERAEDITRRGGI